MEKEVYSTIDTFLKKCHDSSHGYGLTFDRSSTLGKNAIGLMRQYDLVNFGTDDVAAINLVTLKLPNGKKVVDYNGGIEKWISDNETQAKKIKDKELEKLDIDIKNAKRIYKTYWWTFGIAIGAFVIAIISIWLQLKK